MAVEVVHERLTALQNAGFRSLQHRTGAELFELSCWDQFRAASARPRIRPAR